MYELEERRVSEKLGLADWFATGSRLWKATAPAPREPGLQSRPPGCELPLNAKVAYMLIIVEALSVKSSGLVAS
jgi:hypothetical protein